MTADWTGEVREILAHSEGEAQLRKALVVLCDAYDSVPDGDRFDYGVAWKAPRRKKWTYPQEGDYGELEDARSELAIMMRIPNTEARIVRRVKQGEWEFVDGTD